MRISEIEMQGLLSGKCIPGDMKVNESLPAYLVRKFSELHLQQEASEALMLAMRDDSRESRSKLELLTAECAALVNYIDGECYTESKRTGVYTCAGINKPASPATDAMVNEIRAEGADLVGHALEKIPKREMHISGQRHQYIQRSEALLTAEDIANQLRADAAKDGE